MTCVFRQTLCALTSILAVGLSTRVVEASCVDELRIDATAVDRQALRDQLARSTELARAPLEDCRSGRIRLVSAKGGYRVEFQQGHAQVTRSVQSLAVAVMWIESWLVPADKPRGLGAASASESPSSRSEMTPRVGPSVEAGAAMTLALAGRAWLGPELRANLDLSPRVWLAPHAGIGWPISRVPAAGSRSYRVGTGVGSFWPMATRLWVGPYADLSAMSMVLRDSRAGEQATGAALSVGLASRAPLAASLQLVLRAEVGAALWDSVRYGRDAEATAGGEASGSAPSERTLRPELFGALGIGLELTMGQGS